MFTFLKILFVCVTPLINNYQPLDNNFNNDNEVVEVKSRDNFFVSDDYFFLLMEELEGAQFGNDLFSNIDVLGTEFANFPSDIAYPTSAGSSIRAVIGDAVNGSVFGYFRRYSTDYYIIGNNGYPISEISFAKFYVDNPTSSQKRYEYEIIISGRQGNGQRVDYIRFVYSFCFPMYYALPSSDYYIDLGNRCYIASFEFPTGSPLGYDNYWYYVYQEYVGTSYPSPFYNAYYKPLYIDTSTARQQGYNEGYSNGRSTGYNEGYQSGYTEGLTEGSAGEGVPAMIFSGILNVALLPVDIFLQMFQYEVFGINIAGLISGLLTVAMVITVLRFVMGGKSKDD